jgi:hypothetical protein
VCGKHYFKSCLTCITSEFMGWRSNSLCQTPEWREFHLRLRTAKRILALCVSSLKFAIDAAAKSKQTLNNVAFS